MDDLLRKAEVQDLTIHDVYTFLASRKAAMALAENPKGNVADYKHLVDLPTDQSEVYQPLHCRPLLEGGLWTIKAGPTPTYSVGRSTLVAAKERFCLRILRQGIGILTATSEKVTDGKAIVESFPPEFRLRAELSTISSLTEYARGIWQLTDCPPKNGEIGQVEKAETPESLEVLSFDTEVGLSFGDRTSYRVFELAFDDESQVFEGLAEETPIDVTKEVPAHYLLLFYCLTRSYDVDTRDANPLYRTAGLTNIRIFDDLTRGTTLTPHAFLLRNYSQNKRFFITLGPRGAIVAYRISDRAKYTFIRVGALNMVEILRGRYHNLVAARTLLDDTSRRLAALAFNCHGREAEGEIQNVLAEMMRANYIYSLVVSDPGAYLLDGSTLSNLDTLAQNYFHLRSLREDTERKMEALQRLWFEFQDQRRNVIIRAMASQQAGLG